MFGGIKDTLASAAAKSLLASRMDRYGKLTELHLNSKEKSVTAEVVLEGEVEPVAIHIGRYRVGGEPGKHTVTVESVEVSRVWLKNLLEDVLVGKELPVPTLLLVALGKPES